MIRQDESMQPLLTMNVESGQQPMVAELSCIDEGARVYELTVDGIPQSRVSLSDPTVLDFAYVRQIARLIDAWGAAGHPLRVAHLGGGAMTIARYVSQTRPGSIQCVVENEQRLSERLLRVLPLAQPVALVYGDARAIAESSDGLGAESWREADVTIVDLWSAASIPSRVASLEFYRLVASRVAPGGVVAINLLDGPGFRYLKGQVAAVRALFESVAVVLDKRMLGNTAIGNALVFACNRGIPRGHAFSEAYLWFEGETEPPALLTGEALNAWVGDARPAMDADACDSPPPDESHFQQYWARPFFAE